MLGVPPTRAPMALAQLHAEMETGETRRLWFFEGDLEHALGPAEPGWSRPLLRRTIEGAGFAGDGFIDDDVEAGQVITVVTRLWSLPDFVGPSMQLLICGLNPSPNSADCGVGFHRAGNRFWPAAIRAGLVTRDRDPSHALTAHGMGMTDLVKRPTRRADELDKREYQAGMARLTHLVEWLEPKALCMVGLAGWRAAVDRKAHRGWQSETVAGRPVYVMPSTSGLNAHDTIDTLTDHLRAAARP